MSRLLFVASEAYPLIKTGGLADVAGSLPAVLEEKGVDVRLLIPAYQDCLASLENATTVATLDLAGTTVQVLEARLPGSRLVVWLLRHPLFSERSGNPYLDEQGRSWADNAERFMLLCRLAADISTTDTPLDWRPDILHCNDWHTGPAVALTHLHEDRPLTVFTIHNLAHLGLFDQPTFTRLQLPEHFWHEDALEFHEQLCFMKGGLVYADYITTVSPTYAEEICRAPGGCGLEGLLNHRRQHLHGILNGIDDKVWNPAADPFIEHRFDDRSLENKFRNKPQLQQMLGLAPREDCPLIGFVGRLVEQKGIELILPVVEDMLAGPAQLVMLGTGEHDYEQRLQVLAATYPDSLAVVLEYNEALAHRIEAAADIFLMPSLFEPCGLNQLYSLCYATLPVVRQVGGLGDTVVDASVETIKAGTATGFVFKEPESRALLAAMTRALDLWQDKATWRQLQYTAMEQDFSWQQSANQYLQLYSSGPK
jgi:starch synthase